MPSRVTHRAAPTSSVLEYVQELANDEHATDHLVALLSESAPIYTGQRTDEVDQVRAIILCAFEKHGLPRTALPFVLEELESGGNPQTVAAAAMALRSAGQIPSQAAALLVRAIDRFADADDVIETSRVNPKAPTTVLSELLRTLVRLAPHVTADSHRALRSVADRNDHSFSAEVRAEMERALASLSAERPAHACCCDSEVIATGGNTANAAPSPPPNQVVLQDQDGELTTFGTFFAGHPSVVAFFYTRCMVPEKCSLTITKLARLQQKIAAGPLRDRINIAAITYDPAFDISTRLHAYGIDRGMTFDRHNRLLRTPHGIESLRRYFDLQVGFGASTVNRHRLELFVLDDKAEIAASFTRMQWHEEEIYSALQLR
jgi:cytochrome oxidase Cu insertion factor (SCO1/SenC/PrrC family)